MTQKTLVNDCAVILRQLQEQLGDAFLTASFNAQASELTIRYRAGLSEERLQRAAEEVVTLLRQHANGSPTGRCATCQAGPVVIANRAQPLGDGVRTLVIPLPAVRQAGSEERYLWWQQHGLLLSTAATALFLLSAWITERAATPDMVPFVLYIASYVAGGAYATFRAVRALLAKTVDIDLLMILAALGAAVLGAWVEGGILLFLFSLGNALEHYALGRTHRAVRALIALRPDTARVVRENQECVLPIEHLRIGDEVIVKPGERIPVDGTVVAGESGVDESAITGESLPIYKRSGDTVLSGTLNTTGLLRIRVDRLAHESTLARIIRIVEEAREQKSRAQRFAEAFQGKYAVGVIILSVIAFVVPVLLGAQPGLSFYRAITLLVAASPCALVISTPASILSALANAARNGVLFKGALQLETLGVATAIVFDKTGTLTIGKPRLTELVPAEGVDAADVLRLIAPVEYRSEHPLGLAVVAAAQAQGLFDPASVEQVEALTAIPGRGIEATFADRLVLVGNELLFEEHGVPIAEALEAQARRLREQARTVIYAGVDGRVLALLAIADTVRPVARDVIAQLRQLGVQRLVMLTGDNERAARAIAREVGLDEWRAGLLPEEKVEIVRALQATGYRVVMVGDGVNDAPALAVADIGIAMGAAGTDVALETADVVLMGDDLTKLPYSIELSRTTRRVILQNLAFALSIIAVLVTSIILHGVPLPLAVVGHEGSTIVVVLNGLRLLVYRSSLSARNATLVPAA